VTTAVTTVPQRGPVVAVLSAVDAAASIPRERAVDAGRRPPHAVAAQFVHSG